MMFAIAVEMITMSRQGGLRRSAHRSTKSDHVGPYYGVLIADKNGRDVLATSHHHNGFTTAVDGYTHRISIGRI